MTLEQKLVRLNEDALLAEIEELKAYNAEILSASAEIRAMKNAVDRSNLALAQENKRLREIIRSYAESAEKCHLTQMKEQGGLKWQR